MAGSYRSIDYRLRPAKSIERKMLAESFRCLRGFGAVDHYRYIGMGSIYFADFSLFHRVLGIESMVSIEDEDDPVIRDRFMANVPFGNIEVKFGRASGELQKLTWEQRSIVWLDYDGRLTKECLTDIEYVARHAPSGSVIMFSVNAGALENPELHENLGRKPTPLECLSENVGSDAVPPALKDSDLAGWGVGKVYRAIALEKIADALKVRNGALGPGARFKFKQLYYFEYQDGVKMVTVGGVLYDEGQENLLVNCQFEQFSFCSTNDMAYRIDPPLLTYSEMRQIEANRTKPAAKLPLFKADIQKYERTYRYFPKFVEAEVG